MVLTLAGLGFAAGLTVALSASANRAEQTALVDGAVPALMAAHDLRIRVELLRAQTVALARADTTGDVDRIGADLAGEVGLIVQALADGQSHFEVWQRDLLGREFSTMEALAEELTVLAGRRVEQQARLADLSTRLSLLNLQGLGWLEARLAETSAMLDASLGEVASEESVPEEIALGEGGLAPDELIHQFRQIAAFSELRNLAHRINEQLRWALVADEGRELGWVRTDLQKSFEAAEGTIASLPPGPGPALATAFDELETLALGPAGILEERASGTRLDFIFAEKREALAQSQARLLGVAAQFEGQAQAALKVQTDTMAAQWQASSLIPVGLAVLLMIAAGVGLSLVVDRGISRRLASLSDQARALADGRLNEAQLVSGADEIADASRVLDCVRARIRDLQRSNDDLDRYASAALNDFRAPLAGIAKLADWIAEDAVGALPADSRGQLEMLKLRSERVQAMLGGALDHARPQVDTDPEPDVEAAKPLDLENMARTLMDLAAPEGGFRLTYRGASEAAAAHGAVLNRVLLNLITNAVMHHDREGGEVLLQAELSTDALNLRLLDDGPGIPAETQESLRTAIATAGSEVPKQGLVLVNRIVEEAGGEITLISDPQKFRGTAFALRWPLTTAAVAEAATEQAPQEDTVETAPADAAAQDVSARAEPGRRRLFSQAA
ncbi:MAG: HAMP domain-containing sensor histidine kinase [Pseudomonadota bacterium]